MGERNILFFFDDSLSKRQVIVTSLGCCCRHSGESPRVPIPGATAVCKERWEVGGGEGEMEDERGIVRVVRGVPNLGRLQLVWLLWCW